jgi:signal transduction histidine kinase
MREARFMGTVTAMAMHDMQNVLAIIRESAGLVGDLLEINKSTPFKHRDALERAVGHITRHVERGKGILEAMGRLAHAPDDNQLDHSDLAACCRAVVQLTERLAHMKNAEVRLAGPDRGIPVGVGTLPAMTALFLGLSHLFGLPGPDGRVVNVVALARDGAAVARLCLDGLALEPGAVAGLDEALRGTGARPAAAEGCLELSFPLAGPRD